MIHILNEKISKDLNATACRTLDDLLSQSDFVSLHCPSTTETRGIINNNTLSKMKKTAYLINTARGDIVNQIDLINALENKIIKGAGLDVYEKEPNVPNSLKNLKNVFLLPHLGSATEETREAMGFRVLNNLELYSNNKPPLDRVV